MRTLRQHAALRVVTAMVAATAGVVLAPAAGAASKKVELQALCTKSGAEGEQGCTSRVGVSLGSGGSDFRVSFSEDEVAGTGDQWRAAGWNAATTATLLTGAPLSGKVEFEVTGAIDGPSAGALMTVGILSLLRGDTIKKNVTMTGTINPDGTVGPVGGIPLKVDGAKQAKKTVMLIPDGQRNSPDSDGNLVDVVDVGKDAGVKVHEVPDIYAAYKAFTGKNLPQLAPTRHTELSTRAYNRLEKLTAGWVADFESSDGAYGALDPSIQGVGIVNNTASLAVDASNKSADLAKEGIQAGAYTEAVKAAAFANATVKAGQAIQIYVTQGAFAFISQIKSSAAISDKADAFFSSLEDFKPKNLSEASGLIEAYGQAIDAVSLSNQANSYFDAGVQATTQNEALGDYITGAIIEELAGTLIENAKELQGFSSTLPGPAIKNAAGLDGTADFFRKAAQANLDAFDTLVVASEADAAGVSKDVARDAIARFDTDYELALQGSGTIGDVIDTFSKNKASAAYANLGGAAALYARAATLLEKYYSLGAQFDENGNITGVNHEQALLNALDAGASQASGVIGVLKSKKADAALIAGNYEIAGVEREGDISSKFDALSDLYSSYIGGRLLSYLGGFEKAGLS